MLYKLYLLFKRVKRKLNVVVVNTLSRNKMRYHKCTIIRPRELKGLKYISIGNNTVIGDDAIITAHDSRNGKIYYPEIIIGNNCYLGEHIHISAINKIEIGNNVLSGR